MRTCCPACSTTFRVTSEQLRLKAGKVRCGQCLAVFNAFESLIEEDTPPPPIPAPLAPSPAKIEPPPAKVESIPVAIAAEPVPMPAEPIPEETIGAIEDNSNKWELPPEETTAESTLAAREAGLVAARELSDTPGYNRWAAGTLASNDEIKIEAGHSQATWPFVLAAAILASVLAAQLLYHFRTAVVQRLPETARLYALAEIAVPLPQNAELVSIDVSDLQSDNARGLLVLQATLRNRAAFAQAWPALELTLTDARDTIISRRILHADEYLPPTTESAAFPARSDMAIRLWLEAKGVGAAGYRLYLFYP